MISYSKKYLILLLFFVFPFQILHASPPEEFDRGGKDSKKTLASILTSERYLPIYTPENTVSFMAPDGSWIQGLRCGTPHPTPEEAERVRRAVELYLRARQESVETFRYPGSPTVIPIAFHIVRHNDGTADVPNSQIQDQLDVLNAAYLDSGFQFTQLSIDRYYNTAWSTQEPGSAEEAAMKNALAVDPETTLNLYLCDLADGLLGYATFPWMYPENSSMHGVVILYTSVPGGTAAPFNEGDTATHEIGHYLGLYHTFQDGCTEPNDEVDDTPQEESPASGCPTGRDSCPADPGLDPIENYMDYSDDSCLIEFTTGQAGRMDTLVEIFRPRLMGIPPEVCNSALTEGFDDITSLAGDGWVLINRSDPIGTNGWFQGNSNVFWARSGAANSYIAANFNNTADTGTISNWLITPELSLSNIDSISFWTSTIMGSTFPDRLEVRLSTNGDSTNVGTTATSVGDFSTLLLVINNGLTVGGFPQIWTKYVIDSISASGSGRIAFRYFVTNAGPLGTNSNYIGIDTLEVCKVKGFLPAIFQILLGTP
jgi:hypothetical protein